MSTKTICKCGHAIHEHTYSEDFSGCDVVNCECSLDLGGLIDLKDAELLALRERVAKKDKALTRCITFLTNVNTITDDSQIELLKELIDAGRADLADAVSIGGFGSAL